ncbi:Flp family type IVb pilin [Comamonas aquatilis]|uniref:Flp family type IVb pilin n=1 Tax=Comamonas aquatilis TaxID=1778406 RepID=UPI0039EFC100
MKDQIVQFLRDEEGATAIEYALLAGLVAVGLVAALGDLKTGLADLFKLVVDKLPKT